MDLTDTLNLILYLIRSHVKAVRILEYKIL